MIDVEILDPDNADDVRSFEENFYKAFLPLSNPGIRRIWLWDDENRRLKTKIPYEDQTVYIVRDKSGSIVTAYAINFALNAFQFTEYQFEPPEDRTQMVESLATFNLETGHFPAAYIFGWKNGISRGRKYNYATSSEKLVKLHLRAGFEVLAESVTEGQKRYFIRQDIEQALRRYQH